MTEPLVYEDSYLREILRETRTIAMIGASPKWVRPSNFALKYLLGKGFKVVPINPGAAGTEIQGQMTYASLADVPGPVDMVDIFRASKDAGPITDEVLRLKADKNIKFVWMQIGVRDDDAAERAHAAGLKVVMDRCPKIEYGRLFGELSWCGVNSGIISSKRRRIGA